MIILDPKLRKEYEQLLDNMQYILDKIKNKKKAIDILTDHMVKYKEEEIKLKEQIMVYNSKEYDSQIY